VKRASARYSLADLAESSGLPARTVRYYIARGLLDGPEKAGRGACYGPGHLDQLRRIQQMQSAGRTLVEIARELDGGAHPIEPAAWWQYAVSNDVVVMVKAESSPWRLKQVRAALEQFAAQVRDPAEKE